MSGGIVITGQAYQRPVSLAVNADTLTWRARPPGEEIPAGNRPITG